MSTLPNVATLRKLHPNDGTSLLYSSDLDAEYSRRRSQQRAWFQRKAAETIADPDDLRPSVVAARNRYLAGNEKRRRGGNPCHELPSVGSDLQVLADTFAVRPERLAQGLALQRHGLFIKAKRLLFCGVIGRRVNCTGSEEHRFFQLHRCHSRYCEVCGPAWFRQKFSDAVLALEPVVEHLLHEGRRRRREMVIAKLDFTVPNTGVMSTPEFVRKFHADLRRFWRAAERRFGISREEYGFAGCDEFGGGNTNLHRHCVYVGPKLPQRKRRKLSDGTWLQPELTALWSEIRGERSFVSIKYARSFRAALAHALKYPAKFLSASTPERLAELEATFHGTRRFSAGGAFYNVKSVREPGEDSQVGECPQCGARLCEIVEPWVSRHVLEAEGRRNVEDVRREIGRANVFSAAGPP